MRDSAVTVLALALPIVAPALGSESIRINWATATKGGRDNPKRLYAGEVDVVQVEGERGTHRRDAMLYLNPSAELKSQGRVQANRLTERPVLNLRLCGGCIRLSQIGFGT